MDWAHVSIVGGLLHSSEPRKRHKFGMSLAKSSRDGFALSGTSRIAGEEEV